MALYLATADGAATESADLAASFQEAVVEMLIRPTMVAARELDASTIALTGGVAANSRLRERLAAAAEADGRRLVAPLRLEYRTDNAAMIALAGRLPPAARRARRVDDRRRGKSRAVTRELESPGDGAARRRGDGLRPAGALALAGVHPHKSKGQNFLVQPRVADRIVAAAEIANGDDVIEIGPGLGILSERLVEAPVRRLFLIEIDERLAARLAGRFAGDSRVSVIIRDFLALTPRDFAESAPCADRDSTTHKSDIRAAHESRDGTALRIVANLPFNVAAAILEKLCGFERLCGREEYGAAQVRIARMVLMFQREVAERIRARPGADNYGALSVYTSMYWEIVGHFRVAAGSFHPRPKVDAEVLTFAPRRPLPFAPEEESAVLATVRAAFSAPRKTLRNAVSRALTIEAAPLEAAFERAAIEPGARAATLAVDDLVRLARALGRDRPNGSDRDA